MNKNINYFSDDEDDYFDETIEEIDDDNEEDLEAQEIQRLVHQAVVNKTIKIDYSNESAKSKPTNQTNNTNPGKPGKKTLNLSEFNNYVDEQAKKIIAPKKFVSRRADGKKKELGINESYESKRTFNARLSPYNFVFSKNHNIENLDFTDIVDFPEL